jgi:hypothetical protein
MRVIRINGLPGMLMKILSRYGKYWLHTAVVLLVAGVMAPSYGKDPRGSIHFYISNYGAIDGGSDALVARAHEVFERVRSVSDKSANRLPALKVIRTTGEPWAVALPDGYVVLSKGALELCYNGVSKKTGDTRLAFVLGHELAHLSHNDFWHRDVQLALSGTSHKQLSPQVAEILLGEGQIAGSEVESHLKRIKEKELEADDAGFAYAAMAGYEVGSLLVGDEQSKDFLSYWVSQTTTRQDISHLGPKDRIGFLKIRLQSVREKVGLFLFGSRLAHFGQYEDALYFLEEFQKSFPSREVLNNLGLSHLQIAKRLMDQDYAYRFWLPSIMELETRVPTMQKGLEPEQQLSEQARTELYRAADYLYRAVEADPYFLPARINLTAAYIYLQELHKARSVIEGALKLSPDNGEVKMLRALTVYLQNRDIDMWPYAVEKLSELAKQTDAAYVKYNLAQLYGERARDGRAKATLTELWESKTRLPEPYGQIVCSKLDSNKNCRSANRKDSAEIPWALNVPLGKSIKDPQVKGMLQHWQDKDLGLSPILAHLYESPEGTQLLALDDILQIAVIHKMPLNGKKILEDCCLTKMEKAGYGSREVWKSDNHWAAIISNGVLEELWVNHQ